ncbi:MAG TPA: YceI family protein [Candidatus Sulfotelmatobacter sp.]|nr:YceI family protein [Candidatus Sulfotelmatobacter sp.]
MIIECRQLARLFLLSLFAITVPLLAVHAQSSTAAPVYKITPVVSKITFGVKASVSIEGTFDRWNANLSFKSPDVSTGVLDVRIEADSVNTGSSFKDDKLKGEDFFNAKHDPYITFRSTKITKTGLNTYSVAGIFTIRGVSKPETLTFVDDPEGKGVGEIKGTMAFDRKEFGMDSGIPFIRIADRVEVTVDFKAKRISGAPLLFKE